ncbi:MAG: SipW-dependent-type signal peptide-containing protein [Firmicutes bacterium]|nr:SipW-dependent-type signal peptide-containing protein [Bacillota bacterium]
MNTKRSTKSALISSLLILTLCMSMMVGTTYAWFTDEVKSEGNIIQAGKLEIALEKYNAATHVWENAEGKTIAFKTNSNSNVTAANILWEPGCTFWMESIRIKNTGDLALKYEIALSDITGASELLNAIEFTYVAYDGNGGTVSSGALNEIKGELLPDQTSGDIIIMAHMKEDAGNECQGKKLENISVVVFAQQLTHEYDTLGNQYDAMVTPLKGGIFTRGSRTEISIELAKITGITDKNSFYIDILDQNGDVITKITPTEACITNYVENGAIKGNGITACCVVYGGDSGSWDNTAFVPTLSKMPTTAVLYLNGAKAGECKIAESHLTWQDVVDGYNASVNP